MAKRNNRTLARRLRIEHARAIAEENKLKAEAVKRSALIMELWRSSEYLAQSDIADWRNAWQSAIDVRNPNRLRLLNIYRDAMADSHLSGCIQQRVGFVMSRSFKLVNASGDTDDEAQHLLDQSWFKDLCRYCLDSNWYGHSLIELGDIVTDGDGHPSFSEVRLIPRRHVIPEYHRVVPRVGNNWQTGIDYHERPWSDSLIEAGRPDDLGLLLKAALHTIPKKHASSFWDNFAEIFGMPWRIARTSTRDPKEFRKLEDLIYNAGKGTGMVSSMDTEIQFIESGKGDAFNVYDRRIDRANSELSKLVIGQTMTIEDGSSLSQSQTHLQVFENLVESDRDMLRDIINNQLLPRMARLGFPVKGLRFEWDDAIDYTPEQQVAYEKMIADRYDVDPSYFAEKYGMPVGKRLNPMAATSVDGTDDDKKLEPEDRDKKKGQNSFFD